MNLTKREYFAAMAMQGIESANIYHEAVDTLRPGDVVKKAVKLADLLIKELTELEQKKVDEKMKEAQIAPAFSHFYDGYMD